jgi:twitching motility protein PilI
MDKKQRLRDLQTRLAEKLQAVRSGNVTSAAAWLAVETGQSRYLFPLGQSGEIFPITSVQKVAHTQNWYLGVANMRGALFGVVDFVQYVNGQRVIHHMEMQRSEARFVTLNSKLDVNCALFVDRLDGLRSAESFSDSQAPKVGLPDYFGHTYTDVHGVQWQEINLQLLSQQASFLNINA